MALDETTNGDRCVLTLGCLAHLKVVDLSRVLAGPWASQTLGDFGADVVKIERPGSGDDTRSWGPPFLENDGDEASTGDAAYFLCANRNKKSLCVDIATEEGARLVKQLVTKADVVIENFKVGGLRSYGLDYESLHKIKPDLIYCSITGFGQTGPYASRPGYDALIQAMGGLMSITGAAEALGGRPQKVGVAVADILSGLYATVGILAALTHRDRTGVGQHIDVALLDVQTACLANQALNCLVSGKAPARMGNAHPNIVPYQDFATSDGAIIVAVGNDAQFRRFCSVIGRPDLGENERYASNASRLERRSELIATIAEALSKQSTRHWIDLIEPAGVPCGPINDICDVFADPQVIARGMQLSLDHPVAGRAPSVANPLKMSVTPPTYRSAPPTLGQHSKDVLRTWLGFGTDEIEKLCEQGVL